MNTIKLADFIDVVTDCSRRDLCINSIAKDTEGNLIDPFNGTEDIDNKILRHTSEAFAEDPVRVLRIARFKARFGKEWTIAPETVTLVKGMVEDGVLNELVPERVFKELEKALSTKTPSIFFTALSELGALDAVFPELEDVPLELIVDKLDNDDCNPLHNFGKLITSFVPNHAWRTKAFIERLKVPNKFVDAKTLWRSIENIFSMKDSPTGEGFDYEWRLNQRLGILGFLIMDLVVANNRICDTNLMDIMMKPLDDDMRKLLFLCRRECNKIGFKDLELNERDELQGSEISDALNRLKLRTIVKHITESDAP